MVRKLYKHLTKDQLKRGVVFSSALSNNTSETSADIVHEVFESEPYEERVEHEKRLKDDSFFSGYKNYNIIRQGTSKKKIREMV